MIGSIPSSFSKLEDLVHLYLNNNKLGGKIPGELREIRNLHYLDLSNNQLSGKIPFGLGYLLNLGTLNLSNNQLNNTIPDVLFKLPSLVSLNLSNNKLFGTIPPLLLNNLRYLLLDHNYLSGTIPEDLFAQPYFNYLNLSHNQLSGKVPLLSRYSLKKVFIDSNHFNFWGMEALAKREPYFDSLVYAQQRTDLYIHKTGTTLYVNAGGKLVNNTYNWYKNDVLVATITGDSSYTPFAAGKYTVQVTNAIADKLTLFGGPRYAAGSATLIAPNPAAYKADDVSLKAYPNPAHSYTVVSFKAADNGMLQLSDVKGNILQTRVTNTGTATTKIVLDQYAPGVYFITLRCKNGVQTLEIEKQ